MSQFVRAMSVSHVRTMILAFLSLSCQDLGEQVDPGSREVPLVLPSRSVLESFQRTLARAGWCDQRFRESEWRIRAAFTDRTGVHWQVLEYQPVRISVVPRAYLARGADGSWGLVADEGELVRSISTLSGTAGQVPDVFLDALASTWRFSAAAIDDSQHARIVAPGVIEITSNRIFHGVYSESDLTGTFGVEIDRVGVRRIWANYEGGDPFFYDGPRYEDHYCAREEVLLPWIEPLGWDMGPWFVEKWSCERWPSPGDSLVVHMAPRGFRVFSRAIRLPTGREAVVHGVDRFAVSLNHAFRFSCYPLAQLKVVESFVGADFSTATEVFEWAILGSRAWDDMDSIPHGGWSTRTEGDAQVFEWRPDRPLPMGLTRWVLVFRDGHLDSVLGER